VTEARISASPAVFVAVVTGGGAVGIANYTAMLGIGVALRMRRSGVAVDAGETREVRGNLMAIVADRSMMRNREERPVIECGAQPTGSCVAAGGVAGEWESSGNVIGDGATEGLRALPSGLMAAVAGGVCRGKRVVAIDVAGGAGRFGGIGVSAGQRPASGAVIEFPVGPEQRVMASGALRGREAGGDVIGDLATKGLRAGPIGLVAAVAIGVGGGQVVIVADVTLRAGGDLSGRRHLMGAG